MKDPALRSQTARRLIRFARLALVTVFGACAAAFGVAPSTSARPIAEWPFRYAQTYETTPGQSDVFVDMVGADSHFSYSGSPYVTKYSAIAPQLADFGIRHIRDWGLGTEYSSMMSYFLAHGVRHSIGYAMGNTTTYMNWALDHYASETDFVEGPNEYDGTKSVNKNWAPELLAMQKRIYDTVKANKAGRSLTVIGTALADESLFTKLGDMQSIEDVGALHAGTCDYNPGTYHYDGVAKWFTWAHISTPTKPIWVTESGYDTISTQPCSLPTGVAAKYDPRLLAEFWNDGGARLYFFELVDEPADPVFGGRGLISADGAPKPQFTAVQSLLHLLDDPGPRFKPVPIAFQIDGTGAVHHTLLQRRDGTYELMLWLELPSWDHDTRRVMSVAPQAVEVVLPARPSMAVLHSYNAQWKLLPYPVETSGRTIRLNVTDSISVLSFR